MFQPDNLDTQKCSLITELGHIFLHHRAKLVSVVVRQSLNTEHLCLVKDGTQIDSPLFSSYQELAKSSQKTRTRPKVPYLKEVGPFQTKKPIYNRKIDL